MDFNLRKKLQAARARQLAKELKEVADEKKPITIPSPPRMGKVFQRGTPCPFARRLVLNPPVVKDSSFNGSSKYAVDCRKSG